MTESENLIFEEEQHFRQLWVWLILLGVSFMLTYGIIQQLYLGIDWGSDPMSDPVFVIVWLIFALGFPVGFYSARLTTRVYQDQLSIQLFPLHFNEQTFPLEHIESVEATTYRPILDYGGWGIRYGRKGKAYNIAGKEGVKIHFQSGQPLLIGSQKPNELAQALEKARSKSPQKESGH